LKALTQMVAGGSLAAGGGYYYSTRIEPQRLVVERVQVPLKHLASTLEGFKIVHLSDLHLHPYTQLELIQEAVAAANTLQPDLVVLTGDYVLQGAESIFELGPVLAALNGKYGVFASPGNHDYWTDIGIVRRGLEAAGLPLLCNAGVELAVGQASLYLAGLDDVWSGVPDLQAALTNRSRPMTTILLAHEPDWADNTSVDGRVSLQLSGHTHGGQIRIPGWGPLVLPLFGQKYDQGLHWVNNMWVYTNRGVGVIGPPVRFNCPPEVTEITLVGV